MPTIPAEFTCTGCGTLPKYWWLDSSEACWLIQEGGIDVFLVARKGGGPDGARHHLYRLNVGSLVIGLPLANSGLGLLAVACPDSQIQAIQVDEHTTHDLGFLNAAEKWMQSSMDFVSGLPPTDCATLLVDAPLVAGRSYAPSGGVAWLTTRGQLSLFGRATLDPAMLALPSKAWVEAGQDASVTLFDPSNADGGAMVWQALNTYHEALLRVAQHKLAEMETTEVVRLKERTRQTSQLMEAALLSLAGVVHKNSSSGRRADVAPLVACFRAVANHMGIVLEAHEDGTQNDSVEAFAEAAGIRVRRTALRDDWWRNDCGPLIGTRVENGAVVALLPLPVGKGYVLLEHGVTGERPVDEVLATQLAPFAYCLYRPPPEGKLSFLRLLRFGVRGLAPELWLLSGLSLMLLLLGFVMPIATGLMIDSAIPSAEVMKVFQLSAVVLLVALASATFELVRAFALLRIETRLDGTVQAAIWDRVLRMPVPFFRQYSAGDLADRIQGIDEARRALSGSTVTTLLGGAFSLGNFALLLYYSPRLALVAGGIAFLAVIFMASIGVLELRLQRKLSALAGKLSGKIIQYLSGISKLRVAAAENRAFVNWAHGFARLRSLGFRARLLGVADDTFFSAYSPLATATLFGVIGFFLLTQAKSDSVVLTTGEFVAFNAAFGAFLSGIVSLANISLSILRMVPMLERTRPILEALPETDGGKIRPRVLQGRIELSGLCFQYGDGPAVLDNVSFSVEPGSFIAVVGPSGSGKSTLLRLLLGFEQPTAGSVYYDGRDLSELDVGAVRRQLGVVLQNGQLLSGSIFSNIVGARPLTLEDANEAARLCALDEDVRNMPMGMHTVISEGCSTLSGGQRQRILIARAIVNRPRILLFDEATSALDNRTQALVSRSLEQIRATRIVIAHRLSTIINADEIIVLDGGRIVQRGDYKTLVAAPGLFAELAKRQIA